MTNWKKIKAGNFRLINNMGGGLTKPQDFARIRSLGDKNSAVTYDGLRVERQEYIFVESYGLVKCIPYELHFIWEDKSKKLGRWAYMCSCGSIAGIISYNDMKSLMTVDGNESGYVLACVAHLTSKQNLGIGTHSDGSHE